MEKIKFTKDEIQFFEKEAVKILKGFVLIVAISILLIILYLNL